ncbi:ABC transporter permease/substrate-binding protein [Nannocystis punicea]|uniref:ABC transporter permease/substrate-binding protein n=1 Tax=Nannocystis punicea TaxID=2995304 RepID=A0ABY7H6D2_9BACT|nr:ABC transporter permease/substrate-binding protein [Nannocystis poenicansa]WAS94777.1 ABC transporter permease/substrate-binding protein [Nannocystis poenicansa]
MNELLPTLPAYAAAHLQLSLVALLAGVLVSVPLGVLASRHPRAARPLLAVASALQTVPSLALLAFMVPALAAIGAPSIGWLPAALGLFVYSLLPILHNTIAGMRTIDASILEAADGVGMTSAERLRRVELPLALPVILAGIRTAAVWTVGTATLATPVGARSLGHYIFGGLQTRNYSAILLGCAAAAALALLLDALVGLLELGARRRRRGPLVAGALGLLALALAAALPQLRGLVRDEVRPLVVGAKPFTEQYVLSRIVADHLERATGTPATTLESLGSTVVFDGLRSGEIDVYVDYVGTLRAVILGRTDVVDSREAALAEVREALAREGVTVAAALGFENTYVLALPRAQAESLGLTRIGDLARHAPQWTIGGDYELFHRPEWRAIEQAYDLRFAEERSMDPSLLYEATRTGEVQVIVAYSTDGRLDAYDLTTLADDRAALPPYDALVLAGPRLVADHPAALPALQALNGRIDAAQMRRMNAAVDRDGQPPAAVAAEFLAAMKN